MTRYSQEVKKPHRRPTASLVIDIGGDRIPEPPTRSLYRFELFVMLSPEFGFQFALSRHSDEGN